MRTRNVKIADQEYMFMEKVLLVYFDTLQEAGKQYCEIIKEVSTYAIDVPIITARLDTLQEIIQDMMDSMSTIASHLKGSASAFILTVDEKDDFLY